MEGDRRKRPTTRQARHGGNALSKAGFLYESKAKTFMPMAWAILAVACPISPKPMIPMVLPSTRSTGNPRNRNRARLSSVRPDRIGMMGETVAVSSNMAMATGPPRPCLGGNVAHHDAELLGGIHVDNVVTGGQYTTNLSSGKPRIGGSDDLVDIDDLIAVRSRTWAGVERCTPSNGPTTNASQERSQDSPYNHPTR